MRDAMEAAGIDSLLIEQESKPARRYLPQGNLMITIADYSYNPKERAFASSAGGVKITKLLDMARQETSIWLERIAGYSAALRSIRISEDPKGTTPFWINGMIPGLDGMLLYSMVRHLKPKTYLEIGSGNSTKFVRKAIVDGALSTQLVSIDPHPRAFIDAICDEVIRKPCEDVPIVDYMDRLKPNDMVFVDDSHRSFQNSDVTVFFNEIIPAMPEGVLYGIHDIYLPFDYPSQWRDRFYNEQYLLTSYLLGGADGDSVVFPGIYASRTMGKVIDRIFEHPELRGVEKHAGSFWMRRSSPETFCRRSGPSAGLLRRIVKSLIETRA